MKTLNYPEELKRLKDFTELQSVTFVKGNMIKSFIGKGYTEMQSIRLSNALIDIIKRG
jgi:hypothetical protein